MLFVCTGRRLARSHLFTLVLGFACVALLSMPAGAGEATPFALRDAETQDDSTSNITILGAFDLGPLNDTYEGMRELSGLAWDSDEKVLYAISDRGFLLHLQPNLTQGRLAGVTVKQQFHLLDAGGNRLRGKRADAEGLTALNQDNGIKGDTILLVSFERRPRIDQYSPRGTWLGSEVIAQDLRSKKQYVDSNKGLEAVSTSPIYGTLTAPELPLPGLDQSRITVFDRNGPAFTLPRFDAANSALVALDSLADGRLVTMERSHSWLTLSLKINLSLTQRAPTARGGHLKGDVIARLDSALGWNVENFEGLSRHQGRRFFMVSDDNGQTLLNTLLVYFEVSPTL
jgi:hypothetical protein